MTFNTKQNLTESLEILTDKYLKILKGEVKASEADIDSILNQIQIILNLPLPRS